ncbi:MAG: ABC transporter permease subunit, partial [Cyanobacteria bacterium P01_F01_bin.42]
MTVDLPRDYWFPRSLRRLLLALGILGISLAIAMPPDLELINPYGMPQVAEFLRAAIQPDLSPEFLQVTWSATWVTFSYALVGTALSVGVGFCGACLTSEVIFDALFPELASWGIARMLKLLLTIPRSLHEVVWGLLLISLVGLDPIAGVLAIAIPYGAIVAKIFAEILDDTPRDALNSLLHSGSHPTAAIAFGLLPRAKLSLISYGLYRFECSLRSAAILGVIGAGGLGYQMMLSLDSLRYAQLWTLFYAIFLLNGCVDCFSAYIRHRIDAPKRFELKQALRSHSTHTETALVPKLVFLVVSVGLIGVAWRSLNPDPSKLWSQAAWSQLLSLNSNVSSSPFDLELWGRLPWLSLQTLSMSLLAIAIAACGAFCLSWVAAISLGRPDVEVETTIYQRA